MKGSEFRGLGLKGVRFRCLGFRGLGVSGWRFKGWGLGFSASGFRGWGLGSVLVKGLNRRDKPH